MSNKKALIVIDFINDICHPKGKIPSCVSHSIEQNAVANANKALSYAREHNWLTILVKVGFESNYHAQPKTSPIFGQAHEYGVLSLDEFGTDFLDELDVCSSDFVLVKPRISPFYGTNLEAVLRANKIDELYISGVSTTWAIEATTREAHDRDYKVTVIEDACAAANKVEHNQSIETLSTIADIIAVDDLEG
ncbi:isochorismatase family cysteine hydrolase [Vibrio marisflavi]|uniref:Isochorismatase family protein YecD n=1 Tax=Vibrio marisflavi CECT 7928 TaxID=634439 RepID=A0ABN8E1V1_9VIBR|nr:isochorismatase family cysteine hydrolase [Vibrio marisflavi]CAH0537700.1 Isochorismatase family protein YecD [Vibrio marisflavi CECT 7928]